ncbi:MAG: sulfotransferase family protein [archaeon]
MIHSQQNELKNVANQITNVMIIGSMKSGTSTLFNYLKNHPEICPSIVKEPEFFSKNLGHSKYKVDNYYELFPLHTGNYKFTLEASTGYTKFPLERDVPERIYLYGLNPKFIYIVRNPFDRIRSHYNFMQKNIKWEKKMDSAHLINTSNYFLQLREYTKFFSKDKILIVDFEDLIKKQQFVLKKIYSFIEVAHYYYPKKYIISNKTKPINNQYEAIIRNRLNDVAKWFPSPIKSFGNSLLRMVFNSKQQELTKTQTGIIHNALKQDMIKFQETYGFDVSRWGF